jgi:hypothetical protein
VNNIHTPGPLSLRSPGEHKPWLSVSRIQTSRGSCQGRRLFVGEPVATGGGSQRCLTAPGHAMLTMETLLDEFAPKGALDEGVEEVVRAPIRFDHSPRCRLSALHHPNVDELLRLRWEMDGSFLHVSSTDGVQA